MALETEDLERRAVAACLAGETREAGAAWIRAHKLCAEAGDIPRAVANAFWISFDLFQAGEFEAGRRWVDRAR